MLEGGKKLKVKKRNGFSKKLKNEENEQTQHSNTPPNMPAKVQ